MLNTIQVNLILVPFYFGMWVGGTSGGQGAATNDGDTMVIVALIVVGLWLARRLYRRHKHNQAMHAVQLAGIDVMSGHAFEEYVGWLLRQRGYEVDTTPASHDLGADLIARNNDGRVAVQCKRSTKKVGRLVVSDAHAARSYYKADQSMVISNSWYSADAQKLAKATGTQLVDRETLGQWITQIHSEQLKQIFEWKS